MFLAGNEKRLKQRGEEKNVNWEYFSIFVGERR